MDMQEHLLALLAIAVAAGQIAAGGMHPAYAPSAHIIVPYESARIMLPDAGAMREWLAHGLQEQANAMMLAEKSGRIGSTDGW